MWRRLLGVAVVSLLGAAGARASCYDTFGCSDRDRFRFADLVDGPNCEFLYTMRNQIYAEHGYCFHTARARATFGNAGCVTGDASALRLNGAERANVAAILEAERAKGCRE